MTETTLIVVKKTTRKKLKTLAAAEDITMMALVDKLVNDELVRHQEISKNNE